MLVYFLLTFLVIGFKCKVVTIGSCHWVSLPEVCHKTFVNLILYTRDGPSDGEKVIINEDNSLSPSSYNYKLGHKIIIHGYNADHKLYALQNIKDEYLKQGDYNVWMVDWSVLCSGICYLGAAHNIKYVGHCLATSIQWLRSNTSHLDLHVIGFSLGAHIPSFSATLLQPYMIPRITGLDPASPGFLVTYRKHRLSNKSAEFVDVIHTNGWIQGLMEPLGHADFYMNGGSFQPGCFKGGLLRSSACSHVRAAEYMAESINSREGFWAWDCSGFYFLNKICSKSGKYPTLAGEPTSISTRGSFALETNSEAPYAQGNWVDHAMMNNTT